MKQSEIIAYQKLQLKMMKMIHQVCVDNNIEYYITELSQVNIYLLACL